MKSSAILLATLLPFAHGGDAVPDPKIVRRHDRPDSLYVALGARYASVVGHVEDRDESTLVAPQWVLTAAHVIENSGPFDDPWVDFGEDRYRVEKIVLHPDWEGGWEDIGRCHDLALLKLDRPVEGAEPVPLYEGRDEGGKVMTIVGRGKTGTGLTGMEGKKGDVLRGATTAVSGVTESVLYAVFVSPENAEATELEGAAGSGDSGGPAFLERDGRTYLAGVGSFGTSQRGYSAYGSLDGYVRVSSFLEWIRGTIANDAPSTVTWSRPVRFDGRWPDTPAGEAAGAFFAALEAGDREALVELFRRLGDTDPGRADRALEYLRSSLGPIGSIHGYAQADGRIRVLAYFPQEDAWRSVGFTLATEGGEMTLERFYIKWESAPKPAVWE